MGVPGGGVGAADFACAGPGDREGSPPRDSAFSLRRVKLLPLHVRAAAAAGAHRTTWTNDTERHDEAVREDAALKLERWL